jgi:hypothetical protein
MATLRQSEAVCAIYRRHGKDINFDVVFHNWTKEKASKFIGRHYLNYYDQKSKFLSQGGENQK